MAKNLQSKLKPSDKVAIFDVNPTALESLSTEMKAASSGAAIEVAASAHDASKEAVSHGQWLFKKCLPPYSVPYPVMVAEVERLLSAWRSQHCI